MLQEFYEKLIKDLLKRYLAAKDFVARYDNEIAELENKKSSKVTASYGLNPVSGGGSTQEDKIININAKIEVLKKNCRKNMEIVADVEKGLEGVSEMDRDITITIYGTKRSWNKLDKLKEKYHYEKSQLYNIANDTIEHMSIRLYGDS